MRWRRSRRGGVEGSGPAASAGGEVPPAAGRDRARGGGVGARGVAVAGPAARAAAAAVAGTPGVGGGEPAGTPGAAAGRRSLSANHIPALTSRCVRGLGGRRALRHTTPGGRQRLGGRLRSPATRRANCARSPDGAVVPGVEMGGDVPAVASAAADAGKLASHWPARRWAPAARASRCGHTDISRLGDGAGRGGRWRRLARGRRRGRTALREQPGGEPGRSLAEDCRAAPAAAPGAT